MPISSLPSSSKRLKAPRLRLGLSREGETKSRASWGMTIGLASAIFTILLLRYSLMGREFEYDSLDIWFNLRQGHTSNAVAVLEIDDETFARWNGRAFDAPAMARVLQILKDNRARTVVFALTGLCAQNPESKSSSASPFSSTTNRIDTLRNEARDTDFVQWPLLMSTANSAHAQSEKTPDLPENWSVPRSQWPDIEAPVTTFVETPPSRWLGPQNGAGHTSFATDSDNRPRASFPALAFQNRLYPALSLSAAAKMHNIKWTKTIEDSEPWLLDFSPLDLPQSFTHRKDLMRGFPTLGIAQVLAQPTLARGLENKCVVIGMSARGVSALYTAPDRRRINEAQLQAIAIDNLLSQSTTGVAPEGWIWILTMLPCMIVGGFVASRPPMWGAIITLLSLLTIFVLSAGLFAQNLWLDITIPWLAVGLTYLTSVIGRARRDTREATRIGSTVSALAQASNLIAAQNQSQELLERVLEWAREILHAESASVLLFDKKRERLDFAAAQGPIADQLKPFSLAPGIGIAGWVAQNGQAVYTNDARNDARFQSDFDGATGFVTRAIVCVPLRARDEILGVIEVVNRLNDEPFTSDDVEILSAVANQSAIALENARLYELLNLRVAVSEESLENTNLRLETEKHLLQTVLQAMTNGIVVIDKSNHVQLINRAASRVLPELDDAIGQPLGRVLPEFPDGFTRREGDRRRGLSAQLKRGDVDAPRTIEARSSHLPFAANSKASGQIIIFEDVTQQRNIEQAKSDFVSFVAHEMRSPLTTIAGFSSMLRSNEAREATPNAQRSRFLGLIHDESERLKRLINSMLDVARIEAGRDIEIQIDTFEFAPLAMQTIESQRVYSSRHQIVGDWPPDLPPIRADRDKVTQILINLLSNALKYSPGGRVQVLATLQDDFLEVRVQDEGPGIEPDQQLRLFERFGRLSNPVGSGERAKPSGTGLGLFLTKHLVELQGGTIRVESEIDKGSAFIFTLPIAQEN